MTSTDLLNFEMINDEKQSREIELSNLRNKEISIINKTYNEPIICTKKYDLDTSDFLQIYRSKNLSNFVWAENFREDTKQWRLAYDPYMAESMLTIYGKDPP